MQNELYEFCVDALKHIYPEDPDQCNALIYFEEGLSAREWNDNIQGFHVVKANVELARERRRQRELDELRAKVQGMSQKNE